MVKPTRLETVNNQTDFVVGRGRAARKFRRRTPTGWYMSQAYPRSFGWWEISDDELKEILK